MVAETGAERLGHSGVAGCQGVASLPHDEGEHRIAEGERAGAVDLRGGRDAFVARSPGDVEGTPVAQSIARFAGEDAPARGRVGLHVVHEADAILAGDGPLSSGSNFEPGLIVKAALRQPEVLFVERIAPVSGRTPEDGSVRRALRARQPARVPLEATDDEMVVVSFDDREVAKEVV